MLTRRMAAFGVASGTVRLNCRIEAFPASCKHGGHLLHVVSVTLNRITFHFLALPPLRRDTP